MTVSVDVIIPSKTSFNAAGMVKNTIKTLKESEDNYDFNVVIVETMPFTMASGQDMTIRYDKKDFSYNRALNLGLEKTKNHWVVFANNDLVFHKHWFTQIMLSKTCHPEIGSFSPWNSHHGWHERAFPENSEKLIVGNRVCYELAGWCIVTSRPILESIGPLSERCSLWYSDNIYIDALEANGIKHALCCNSRVDHLTSQTINFDEYITNNDKKAYLEGK